MSRLLWGAVALLAVVLVPAAPGGPISEQALAHFLTPTGTPGDALVHVEIDADATNGDGPCNPVDATAEVSGMYKVAVCLTSSSQPLQAFDVELLYNDTLNSCTDVANYGTALDDNPDANAGTSVWPDAAHSLGTVGWGCSADGAYFPVCDTNTGEHGAGKGVAFITCGAPSAAQNELTLPVGADVSAPIAVVTFNTTAGGVDNLAFGRVGLYDYDVALILRCPGADCYGATLFVQAPIGGIAEAPLTEADVLADERASSMPNALAVAGLAAGGALLVAAGGWYARRRRRAG